jgi:hypothetical protein
MGTTVTRPYARSARRAPARALAGTCLLLALCAPADATAATATPTATPTVAAPAAGRSSAAGGAAAPTTTYVPPTASTPLPTTTAGAATTGTTGSAAGTASIPLPATGALRAAAQTPRKHASKLSTTAVAVAVVAGLLALCCLAWAIVRMFAIEPRWTLSFRHATAEAGFRASATWAEFTDWIRTGH